jgi:hypothetical protein
MTIWREPGTRREGFQERFGARSWLRRRSKKALERLRELLEERPDEPRERVSVAGWEPLRGPRFGTGTRPAKG